MNPDLDPIPKPSLTIYIANMAEDVWQLIQTLPSDHKALDIRGCDLTSDRELMSFLNIENFVLISPMAVDPLFIEYANSMKPKTFLQILIPEIKTGRMSIDIMNDSMCISRILELSQSYTIRLESYTASAEFIELVTFLKNKNPNITAPLTPLPENKSVVDFFGSKSGLRNFYEQNRQECSDFMMAKGKVCAHKAEAIAYAKEIYHANNGVVFKTPKGHSGIGVVIAKNQPDGIDFNSLLTEPYWDLFPIIVEEYNQINYSVGGGNPNTECFIDENGQAKILFYCGMRVDEHGAFQGIEIGPNVLPLNIKEKFAAIAQYLSDKYSAYGYKGYFDIDGMININDQLLIAESNVRRTGGTHIYYVALALLEKEVLAQKYIASNNYYSLPSMSWTFETMKSLLSPILYDRSTQTGLVITGANTLQDNYLSYAVIANNKSESIEIENKLMQLLQTRT